MKPPRSLMAFAAFLIAAAAQAAGSWLEIKTPTKSYFINKANHDQLKAGKVGEERKLFDKPEGKDAGAVLRKKGPNALVVVKGGVEEAVSNVSGVTPPKKDDKTTANPVNTAAGDPDVVAAVTNAPGLDKDTKLNVGLMMENLKAKNPAEYARMKAGGAASINAVIAKMAFAIKTNKPGPKNDITKAYEALTQKLPNKGSMLTVALDESNAPVVADNVKKVESVEGVPEEQKGDVKPGETKDLVVVLTQLIQKNRAGADADMVTRISSYMQNEEGGAYLSAAVRQKPDVLKNIAGFVEAWVKAASPADLAILYVVMGSGGPAPAWVADKEVVMMLEKAGRLTKLKTYMKDWTKPGAKGARGQIAQGSREEVTAFLTDEDKTKKVGGLVFCAKRIFEETRTDADLKIDIIKREEGIVIPDNTGNPDLKIKDPAMSFGFDGLYKRGGKTALIYAPGDAKSREFSLKLYTERVNGELVTKVGVWDITNPSNVFGQNLDILADGSHTFSGDDRKPGYPRYELKFTAEGSDTKVTLMREGGKDGGTIETTLGALYGMRAQQAADEGATVDVGGKKFLAMGQGGAPAGVVMYPSDAGSRLGKGEVVSPELFAATTVRSQGRDMNKSGKQNLGNVDGKDYHLAFNSKLQYWEVKEGKVEEPKPKTDEKGGVGTGSTNPTQKDEKKDGKQPTGPITDETVAAAEQALVATGAWERNTDVQNGLDEKYRETVRVYSWIKKYEGSDEAEGKPINGRHQMFVPASMHPAINVGVPFLLVKQDDHLRKKGEVRGIGKYIATTTDLYTAYFDVTKKNENPDLVFYTDLKCFVDEVQKSFCVKDLALLADAMTRGGFNKADIETTKARAEKHIGQSKQYTIQRTWDANAKALGPVTLIVVGKGSAPIFPKEGSWTTGSTDGHQDTKNDAVGPTNAFDKLILAPAADFPKDPQTVDNAGSKVTVHQIKISDDKDAALYADDKDEKKAKVWFLMFNVTLPDGKKARTSFIPVFDQTVKFPGLDKIGFGGVTMDKARANADLASTGALRRAMTSDNRGVYYAVEEKSVKGNPKDQKYKNCVGAVLWWTITKAKAQEACSDDAL